MLRKVYLIWKRSPDLRLLQMLSWIAEKPLPEQGSLPRRSIAARFVDDDRLEQQLDRALQDRCVIDALGDSLGFEDAVLRDDG